MSSAYYAGCFKLEQLQRFCEAENQSASLHSALMRQFGFGSVANGGSKAEQVFFHMRTKTMFDKHDRVKSSKSMATMQVTH